MKEWSAPWDAGVHAKMAIVSDGKGDAQKDRFSGDEIEQGLPTIRQKKNENFWQK